MRRILIADDEPFVRRLVRVNLERAGYIVVEAEDGMTAWELLDEEPFDLLVTDLGMPRMNGDSLIRAMRSREQTVALPVLLMLAVPDDFAVEDWADRFLDLDHTGTLKLLEKPFNPSELKRLVHELLPSDT